MLQRITWPVAFLAAVVASLVVGTLVGVPIWLVATGRSPPALLVGPLTGVLTAGAALVTHTVQAKAARSEVEAAYSRGKEETPSWMTDPAKLAVARSVLPPPLPPLPHFEDLSGVVVDVTTTPETPDAKLGKL